MTQGIQKSTVVLCCVDSEYSKSTNCMLELRHAAKVTTELSPASLRPVLCGACFRSIPRRLLVRV